MPKATSKKSQSAKKSVSVSGSKRNAPAKDSVILRLSLTLEKGLFTVYAESYAQFFALAVVGQQGARPMIDGVVQNGGALSTLGVDSKYFGC